MEVEVCIQASPKSLHKSHRAALSLPDPILLPRPAAERSKDSPGEDLKDIPDQGLIVGQTIAQGEGQRQDPLPDGHFGEDTIHQVRGGIRHPAAGTGRTEPTALTRERQKPVHPAPIAMHS